MLPFLPIILDYDLSHIFVLIITFVVILTGYGSLYMGTVKALVNVMLDAGGKISFDYKMLITVLSTQ